MAKVWRIAAVATVALLVAALPAAHAGAVTSPPSWPGFHGGADRRGVNLAETSLTAVNAPHLRIRWTVPTGGLVAASPAVVDGTVYVGSRDSVFRAIDERTGTVRWNFTTTGWDESSPTVANGKVFFSANNTHVLALDSATGALVWDHDLGPGATPGDPAVVGNSLFVSSGTAVTALDTDTGSQLWRTPVPAGATFYQLAASAADNTVVASGLLAPYTGGIWGLSMSDGALHWTVPTVTATNTPAIADGMAFVTTIDAQTYAVNVASGQLAWSTQQWATQLADGYMFTTPAITGGVVYVQGYEFLHALDEATGNELWLADSGGGYSSPVFANGIIYHAGGGQMQAVDVATHQRILFTPITLGGENQSTPAVIDGMVFVGTHDGHIVGMSPGSPAGSDFDQDYRTDVAVYRSGLGAFMARDSSTGSMDQTYWGNRVDDIPVPADYDFCGDAEPAVYRPSAGLWIVRNPKTGQVSQQYWGNGVDDVPVPANYDPTDWTHRANVAVYRPSSGLWLIRNTDGSVATRYWGAPGDVPVPTDYDGDFIADIAVFRPSTGQWFIVNSSDGSTRQFTWGNGADDVPVPGDYDGVGHAELAVYRPSTGSWFVLDPATGTTHSAHWGNGADDVPVPGDYDGDGRVDLTVFRPSLGAWMVQYATGAVDQQYWGSATGGDIPLPLPYVVRHRYFPGL